MVIAIARRMPIAFMHPVSAALPIFRLSMLGTGISKLENMVANRLQADVVRCTFNITMASVSVKALCNGSSSTKIVAPSFKYMFLSLLYAYYFVFSATLTIDHAAVAHVQTVNMRIFHALNAWTIFR